jgi:hypothetical protein
MATKDEAFPSKYLKAADLQGRAHVVEIEGAWEETLKSTEGKEQIKTILKFKGKKKILPLNLTNWDAVAEITGEGDSIAWPSHAVEIYPTKTQMGGKTVDCIRIRQPNGEAEEAAPCKAKAPAKSAGATLSSDLDDEIPFAPERRG